VSTDINLLAYAKNFRTFGNTLVIFTLNVAVYPTPTVCFAFDTHVRSVVSISCDSMADGNSSGNSSRTGTLPVSSCKLQTTADTNLVLVIKSKQACISN
jgi:hypothetical protein